MRKIAIHVTPLLELDLLFKFHLSTSNNYKVEKEEEKDRITSFSVDVQREIVFTCALNKHEASASTSRKFCWETK